MAGKSLATLGPTVIIYTEVRWAGFWDTPRLEKSNYPYLLVGEGHR
jgi:hypothetical protein